MNYFNNLIKNDPSGTILTFFFIFTVLIISLVLIAYLVDNKKISKTYKEYLCLKEPLKI